MKKCPFCAEDIQADAIKCKHCGEWIKQASENSAIKMTPTPNTIRQNGNIIQRIKQLFTRKSNKPKKSKKSDILRFFAILIGAVLTLGIYTAFFAPLNPSRFVFMLIGLILISVYCWLIVFKFNSGWATVSSVGQLCFCFFIITFQLNQIARGNNDTLMEAQGSITSKAFVVLLFMYIILKVRQKIKKSDN